MINRRFWILLVPSGDQKCNVETTRDGGDLTIPRNLIGSGPLSLDVLRLQSYTFYVFSWRYSWCSRFVGSTQQSGVTSHYSVDSQVAYVNGYTFSHCLFPSCTVLTEHIWGSLECDPLQHTHTQTHTPWHTHTHCQVLSEGDLYLLWRDSDITQISKGD
jgi:hypothetical protein